MFFKKKAPEPAANPYYNVASQSNAEQQPQLQSQGLPQNVQTLADTQQTNTSNYPVPLLPVPEPMKISDNNYSSMGSAPKISAGSIDLVTPKTFAFVKLSSFKQVLDDIKVLQNEISQVADDLDRFNHIIKEEEDTIHKYTSMVEGLKKVLVDLNSSLSNVEE